MTTSRPDVLREIERWRDFTLSGLDADDRAYADVNADVVRALAWKFARGGGSWQGSLSELARFAGASHTETVFTVDALISTGDLRRGNSPDELMATEVLLPPNGDESRAVITPLNLEWNEEE